MGMILVSCRYIIHILMKKKPTELKDIVKKWDQLEQKLELLIQTSTDPDREIYQQRLNHIRKRREEAAQGKSKDVRTSSN